MIKGFINPRHHSQNLTGSCLKIKELDNIVSNYNGFWVVIRNGIKNLEVMIKVVLKKSINWFPCMAVSFKISRN